MTGLQVTEVILIIALYDFLKTVLRAILDFIEDEESEDDKGVLDKISAEIMNLTDGEKPERVWNVDVLQIIDKYRAESEEL